MLEGHNLVYFSPEKWDGLWRNRQQLMSVFARKNRVLFVEGRLFLRDMLAGPLAADLILYNRNPEFLDKRAQLESWVFNEITSIVALENKVVIDGGAGTGKIAFQAAKVAKAVYAVEPVSSLRQFMKEKAKGQCIQNIYVIDGFLHAIPLHDDFVDVLLTCRAIGWDLEKELKEIERVVKPGGFIVHIPMYPGIDDPLFTILTSSKWQYECSTLEDSANHSRKYWKQV